MNQRQYEVVDNGSFIQFVGVAGTLAEGLTFSLQKQNIVKITEKTAGNSVAFFLTDGNVQGYSASELIDPATGLPFVSAAVAADYFISVARITSPPGGLLGTDSNLGDLQLVCGNAVPSTNTFEYPAGGLLNMDISFASPLTAWQGGYIFNLTTGMEASIESITDTTIVSNDLAGGGVWTAGDVAAIATIRRYEIPFNGYDHFTATCYMRTGSGNMLRIVFMGTNNPAADMTSDRYWTPIGDVTYTGTTVESISGLGEQDRLVGNYAPIIFERLLARVDGFVTDNVNPADNEFQIYYKKG